MPLKQVNSLDTSNNDLNKHPKISLVNINVLVITSGHDATDHRVYSKLACSLKIMGAAVTVIGMLEHNVPDDIKIEKVPKTSSRLVRFLWQPWRCLIAARKYKADIIHFHDAEMLITLPIAKILWPGCKFVYDVHEDFANLMLIRDWIPDKFKKIVYIAMNVVEKKLAALADAIVGVTPPLTEKFANANRTTAYNFISHNFFEKAEAEMLKPLDRHFDLVHLGTLNLRRARFLARTIKEFHRLHPDSRSLIVGVNTEISRELKSLIPDNCQLMGKVPYHKIPKILGNTKVGLDIHPWLDPHLTVALPVKVCEYMACGCAVVSSVMPVLNNIISKADKKFNGMVILESQNPTDYAAAVIHILDAIEKGEDPGSEMREFTMEHLMWEKEANKVAKLYLRLLGKQCVI